MGDQQAFIVAPGDPLAARKLEPDARGIARTLLASHAVLGGAGALLGLVIGLALTRQ